MLITLLLPTDTKVPVIGGIQELTNTPLGASWKALTGRRWSKTKQGKIEATYTGEQLAFCIAFAEHQQAKLDNQLSL